VSVDRAEVGRIAELARLRLGDEESARLTAELNGILEHVEALRTLAAEGVEPVEAPHASLASTRPSEESGPDALGAGPGSIAPRFVDGFFTVPPPPGVQHTDADG